MVRILSSLFGAALLLATCQTHAGPPAFTLSLSSASGAQGNLVTLTSSLDNNGGPVQGWSFGLCHDEASIDFISATEGATTLTIAGGALADFSSINEEIGGVTFGVVIDFFALDTLPIGLGYELLEITYQIIGPADTTTEVSYCATLGSPPVSTVMVVGGTSFTPVQESGFVVILNPNRFTAEDSFGAPGFEASTNLRLTNTQNVSALSVSLSYDETMLTSVGVNAAGIAAGAEFFQLQPGLAPGELAFQLIVDTVPLMGAFLAPGIEQLVATLDWSVSPSALPGSASALSFNNGFGSPPLNNVMIVSGSPVTPGLDSGTFGILEAFVRSDCNADTTIDIADGIYLMNYLFAGGPDPTCDDACDSNDDAQIDVSDAIYVWNYALLAGPAPLAPFPLAGPDPTAGDGLGCSGDFND
ncbi:MAG: hypothetical protein ACKVX7_04885 [Planctomycetota bacterium]